MTNVNTIFSKLNSTIEFFDATWITFLSSCVTTTGFGLDVVECYVNIPRTVPNGTNMFTVPSEGTGYLTLVQPYTGKAFAISVNSRLASAAGEIAACDFCTLYGMLINH